MTSLSRVVLVNVIAYQSEECHVFYGTRRSLPCSQHSAICPSTVEDKSSPRLSTLLLKIHLNIIFQIMLRFSMWGFPSGFSIKNLYATLQSPTLAMWPKHFVLLHLFTLTTFGKNTPWRSSLCCLLQFPFTATFLGQNMPLSNLF